MVDVRAAHQAEKKVFEILRDHPKLKKYKFELHYRDQKDVDIEATNTKYKGVAIEIENTEAAWADDEPYPSAWKKGFSVPARKHKYYWGTPLSIYVKVNKNASRAIVGVLAFICGAKKEYNATGWNSAYDGALLEQLVAAPQALNEKQRKDLEKNTFFWIRDPEHPGICYCPIEKLGDVVAGQLDLLVRLKNLNEEHTDKRPSFTQEKKKNA